MGALDNYLKKYASEKRAGDWDRRPGEHTVPELLAMAQKQGLRLTRYKFYSRVGPDIENGAVQKRTGRDGKVYYSECQPEKSTPKRRSQRPSDSSPS